MKLEFTIATAADAVQAADILDHIATVLESQGDTVKPTRTRRTKAQMVEAAPVVFPVFNVTPAPTPEPETAPVVYAVELGEVPADLETGPVMIDDVVEEATPEAETVQTEAFNSVIEEDAAVLAALAQTAPAFDRATLIAEIRAACLELGSVWMRNNVLMKAAKLSALTDADLLIVHPAAAAAVVALKASQANLTA